MCLISPSKQYANRKQDISKQQQNKTRCIICTRVSNIHKQLACQNACVTVQQTSNPSVVQWIMSQS